MTSEEERRHRRDQFSSLALETLRAQGSEDEVLTRVERILRSALWSDQVKEIEKRVDASVRYARRRERRTASE